VLLEEVHEFVLVADEASSDVDLLASDNDYTLTHLEFLGQLAEAAKKVTTCVDDNSLK
jgi:hypothetical protein